MTDLKLARVARCFDGAQPCDHLLLEVAAAHAAASSGPAAASSIASTSAAIAS